MWSDSMSVFLISSVKPKISLIQYLLYVPEADKSGLMHSLSLCVLGRPYRCANLEPLGQSCSENMPPIVNTQCVVYSFQCDLCNANYVGFTARHLHQRIREHRYSTIGKHLETQHDNKRAKIDHLFKVLKKCRTSSIA